MPSQAIRQGAHRHIEAATELTIVIPYFEGSHREPVHQLSEALRSVVAQTVDLSRLEVVLVQDGGTDNLRPLLTQFAPLNVRLLRRERNAGLSAARNMGASAASSENLLFLDADDRLPSHCVARVLKEFARNPSWDLCFSNSLKFDSEMRAPLRVIDSSQYYDLFRNYGMSRLNPVFHAIFVGHCIAMRTTAFRAVGGFDISLDCGEITALVLAAFVSGLRIGYIDDILYNYRDNPLGLSKSPRLFSKRIGSIARYYEMAFAERLSRIEARGRIEPFHHFHFDLYDGDGRRVDLPYIDYEHQRIRNITNEVAQLCGQS